MRYVRNCLIVICFMLLLPSCNNSYHMPYEPGIYIDKESLLDEKAMWLENKPVKYSYTYSSICPSAGLNLIANVEVENSSITNTEIVEYNHKTKDDFPTDEEWNKYLEYAEVGDISIDNIFSDCDDFNKNAEDYIVDSKYKDYYYASCEVRFDKQYHFIESCLFTTLIMKEDVDGGSSSEISIRNFKAE